MSNIYNKEDYQIYLDNEYIKNFLNKDIKKYFPGATECIKVSGNYFRVLAASSFLVRYFITLKNNQGHQWKIRMRGNRLNPESYKTLNYLWNKYKYKKYFYPRPIHYFKKHNFILYENYGGAMYRDIKKKSKYLYLKTIPLVAERLADFHNSKKILNKSKSLKDEFSFLDENLRKIKKNNKRFSSRAQKATDIIKKYLEKNLDEKDYTLSHNDFQASNIIYNKFGPNLGIIDFELMSNYLPANDVATFIVHLQTMVKSLFPKKTITSFQQKFINEYGKYVNEERMTKIKKDLPYFMMRSYLDILAITSVHHSISKNNKKNIKRFMKYLEKEIVDFLPKIT